MLDLLAAGLSPSAAIDELAYLELVDVEASLTYASEATSHSPKAA